MKMFDSSPLIAILGNLDKQELLVHFISLGYSLCAPKRVVEEVSNTPEKQNLQSMIKKNELTQLEPLSDEEIQTFRDRFPRLGKGESELILLAQKWLKENKKFCCIIDDSIARKTAEKFGLKCTGTIGLIQKLNGKGFIDKDNMAIYLGKLEEKGFRYNFKSINPDK